MPNWCYTAACLKGDSINIEKLFEDIKLAEQYEKDNKYRYVNLWHFFSLKGLNVEHYLNRYKSRWDRPNFRGSIHNGIIFKKDANTIYVHFDTAWTMSYDILRLICGLYNLTAFSAYSEEPNMGYFTKCNYNDYTYDYDVYICPDWEDLEANDIDGEDMVLVGKNDDKDIIETLKFLKENNIDHHVNNIYEDDYTDIFGIYYEPIRGVLYPGLIYD